MTLAEKCDTIQNDKIYANKVYTLKSFEKKGYHMEWYKFSKKRLHLVLGIIISFMLVVTGVLFCFACYSVYSSAESQMYTYESIGKAFSKIAAPVLICAITVIAGAIVSIFFPIEKEKTRAYVPQAKTLKRLSARVDVESLPEELASEILWKRTVRNLLCACTAVIYVLRIIHVIIYVFDTKNFPQNDITSEVAKASTVISLNFSLLFVITVAVMLINKTLVKKELELVKKAISEYKPSSPKETQNKNFFVKIKNLLVKNEAKTIMASRIVILSAAVTFIVIGVINGGINDVLTKAAEICAECIGLG